jgi:arginine-tRNA-protein transferase
LNQRPRFLHKASGVTSHSRDAPQFYLTSPSACPYLPGKEERKVFTHIVGRRGRELNEILTQGGFRRSQTIAYRPACDTCRACISVRVLVGEFEASGNLRRVLKTNADLIGTELPNRPSSEQYALFRRYVDARHADGGMADMSVLDYSMMVEDSHVDTLLIEYRRRGIDSGITGRGEGDLIAVCLTDVMSDGLSMVYSFYDPEYQDRSLGTFMILDHIRRAKAMGLPYLYLGYWVEGSKKMGYKARFTPQERLGSHGWVRVD